GRRTNMRNRGWRLPSEAQRAPPFGGSRVGDDITQEQKRPKGEDEMMASLGKWLSIGIGALAVLAAGPASAQGFPNRNIVLVVPFAPGGVTDVLARMVAHGIQEKVGQTVVVENRPGAGIAYEHVARAKPDGSTLLFAANGLTISTALNGS